MEVEQRAKASMIRSTWMGTTTEQSSEPRGRRNCGFYPTGQGAKGVEHPEVPLEMAMCAPAEGYR